jgi:hypothetical protein
VKKLARHRRRHQCRRRRLARGVLRTLARASYNCADDARHAPLVDRHQL